MEIARKRVCAALVAFMPLIAITSSAANAQSNNYVIGVTPTQQNSPVPSQTTGSGVNVEVNGTNVEVTTPAVKQPDALKIPNLPKPKQQHTVLEDKLLGAEEINGMLEGSGQPTIPSASDYGSSAMIGSGAVDLRSPQVEEPSGSCEQRMLICHRQRFWAKAEAIGLFVHGDELPPLVTSSTAGTPIGAAGVLGQPTTSILFGNRRLSEDLRLGGRATVGRWLKHIDLVGVQAEVTYISEMNERNVFASTGAPILARPFRNVNPLVDAADATVVAFPATVEGTIAIDTRSEIYSGNFGFRRVSIRHTDPFRGKSVEFLSGFRYMRIAESLRIDDDRTVLANYADPFGALGAGSTFDSFDMFKTQNDFYGFEFGSQTGFQKGRWNFDLLSKVAIGVVHQLVELDGSTTITPALGAATTIDGGLLTVGATGQHARRRFGILPEIRLSAGYQVSKRCSLNVGYQFMMLNDVVRPGNQIDQRTNGTFLDPGLANAGPLRPNVRFNSDFVIMHGATAALKFCF